MNAIIYHNSDLIIYSIHVVLPFLRKSDLIRILSWYNLENVLFFSKEIIPISATFKSKFLDWKLEIVKQQHKHWRTQKLSSALLNCQTEELKFHFKIFSNEMKFSSNGFVFILLEICTKLRLPTNYKRLPFWHEMHRH